MRAAAKEAIQVKRKLSSLIRGGGLRVHPSPTPDFFFYRVNLSCNNKGTGVIGHETAPRSVVQLCSEPLKMGDCVKIAVISKQSVRRFCKIG